MGKAELLSTFRDPSSFVGWGYPSTFKMAGGGWRMMYQGWHLEDGKEDTKLLLAAESADGVSWHPAKLPAGCPGYPTVPNCVYDTGKVELSVIYDDAANAPPAERLKSLLSNNTIVVCGHRDLPFLPTSAPEKLVSPHENPRGALSRGARRDRVLTDRCVRGCLLVFGSVAETTLSGHRMGFLGGRWARGPRKLWIPGTASSETLATSPRWWSPVDPRYASPPLSHRSTSLTRWTAHAFSVSPQTPN